MRDASELTVHEIYDKAWRVGHVDPLGDKPTSLAHFLDIVREMGVRLRAEPNGELESGPYAGGRVIAADTNDGRLYFMIPPEAIPLLREYMPEEDYRELTAGPGRSRPEDLIV